MAGRPKGSKNKATTKKVEKIYPAYMRGSDEASCSNCGEIHNIESYEEGDRLWCGQCGNWCRIEG